MARRKKAPKDESLSTNCITNLLSSQRAKDFANLKKCKDYEEGRKFKYIDHPTVSKCKIRVEIKD